MRHDASLTVFFAVPISIFVSADRSMIWVLGWSVCVLPMYVLFFVATLVGNWLLDWICFGLDFLEFIYKSKCDVFSYISCAACIDPLRKTETSFGWVQGSLRLEQRSSSLYCFNFIALFRAMCPRAVCARSQHSRFSALSSRFWYVPIKISSVVGTSTSSSEVDFESAGENMLQVLFSSFNFLPYGKP